MSPLAIEYSAILPQIPATTALARTKSLMVRAWILTGLFFMALPGTLLGFSNLMAISAHHGIGTLPAAWMEGHGHAQMFGWIGSFILGIGFYSQPTRTRSDRSTPLACYLLWTSGVGMRWFANIYGWHWRLLLPISAGSELVAVLLFLTAASRHKLPDDLSHRSARKPMEMWMLSVLIGTAGLAASVVFNFVECLKLASAGGLRSFPHGLDQKYLVLLGWGFVVPVVWGFSARWLPSFLGIPKPRLRAFQVALGFDLMAVAAALAGPPRLAAPLLAAAAVAVVCALRIAERSTGIANVHEVHPSFSGFVRASYIWLLIAAAMSIWASFADQHGGIWGASRHALTVGFAATMVFAIGPRILPTFAGVRRIFSKRLVFLCLFLLQTGCTLRVLSEPLAYEGFSSFAWSVLPVSGMLELTAVLLFTANLVLTFALVPHTSAEPLADG